MTITYKTKRDINGNTYYLNIDIENKTGSTGYNRSFEKPITVTKRDLHNLQDVYIKAGYTIKYV